MKLKMGAIVTEASGKIGGQFISGDKSGLSLRTKNVKAKRSVVNSTDTRLLYSTLSRAWRMLTQDQRNAWGYAAVQMALKIKDGDVSSLSGFNYFMQVNSRFSESGEAIISTPPVPNKYFTTNVLGISLVSVNPSYDRWQPLGGGLFLCWLPESDPAYNPSVKTAVIIFNDSQPEATLFCPDSVPVLIGTANDMSASILNTEIIRNALGENCYPLNWIDSFFTPPYSGWCLASKDIIVEALKEPTYPSHDFSQNVHTGTQIDEFTLQYYLSSEALFAQVYELITAKAFAVRFQDFPFGTSLEITLSENLLSFENLKVEATQVLSNGITNPRSSYKQIGVFTESINNKVDILSAYENEFGSISGRTGKIFIKATLFDNQTKFSKPEFLSCIILS